MSDVADAGQYEGAGNERRPDPPSPRIGVTSLLVAAMAAAAVGTAVGLVAWNIWWPHSDNRARISQVYITMAGGMGMLLTTKVWQFLGELRRSVVVPWLVLMLAVAVLIYSWAVVSTLGACGSCPPWS